MRRMPQWTRIPAVHKRMDPQHRSGLWRRGCLRVREVAVRGVANARRSGVRTLGLAFAACLHHAPRRQAQLPQTCLGIRRRRACCNVHHLGSRTGRRRLIAEQHLAIVADRAVDRSRPGRRQQQRQAQCRGGDQTQAPAPGAIRALPCLAGKATREETIAAGQAATRPPAPHVGSAHDRLPCRYWPWALTRPCRKNSGCCG